MHDYSKLPGTKKMRFREWLKEKLDKNEVAGVEWIDRQRGLFKIPWKHASQQGWNFDRDAEIFRQWAIHSGRYSQGAAPDPAKWKTNFRCTLNALPDFREVRDRSYPRGPKAYKIYVMKSEELKTEQKANGPNGEKKTQKLDLDLTDKEIVQILDDMYTSQTNQKPLLISRRPNSAFPAFETLVVDKTRNVFPNSHGPTPWFLAAWNAMAVDQFAQKPADNPADKRIMARLGINQEPLSHGDRIMPSCSEESESEEASPEMAKAIAEEEDEIPNDQEIIDLVEQMSEESNSSFEELDDTDSSNDEESLSNS